MYEFELYKGVQSVVIVDHGNKTFAYQKNTNFSY